MVEGGPRGVDVGMRALRATVAARLRARRPELEAAILERLWRVRPDAVGGGDAEYVNGLRTAVAAALDYGLAGVGEGEDCAAAVPAAAVEQARRAARLGVSLDTLVARYLLGNALLGDYIVQEASRLATDSREALLRDVLRTQAALFDRLLARVTDEHAREQERRRRSPRRSRAERVERLLDGRLVELGDLGYELEAWHVGAIVIGPGAGQAPAELARQLGRRLLELEHLEECTWAWLGAPRAPTAGELEHGLARVAPLLEHSRATLALGEPAAGIEGWRLTHRQAQAAMLVALRDRERPAVTRYRDVALLACVLRDETLGESFVEVYLGPLRTQRDGGASLRCTLRAYMAAGRNLSSAAAALGVARQTIEGRLRSVEELLGRPLHTCVAEIETALRVDGLARGGSGGSAELGRQRDSD